MVQALVTLHGTAFDEVSRDSSSRLLQALNAPHMNDSKRLQWLFLSTLNRNPTKQEEAAFSNVINEAMASSNAAIRTQMKSRGATSFNLAIRSSVGTDQFNRIRHDPVGQRCEAFRGK